jgi:hypothetical protein
MNRKGVAIWFKQKHNRIRYMQRNIEIYCLFVTPLRCPPRGWGNNFEGLGEWFRARCYR